MSREHVAAYYAGDLWLAYCSNVSPSRVEDLKASNDAMVGSALALAAEGFDVAVENARMDHPGHSMVSSFIEWLRAISRSTQNQRSRAHQLRAHAGGTILHEIWPDTGDAIIDYLTRECLRSYPAALIPPRMAFGAWWNLPMVDTSSAVEFECAVKADVLNRLFPRHSTDPTSDGSAYWQGPGEAAGLQISSQFLEWLMSVSFRRVFVITGSASEDDVIRAAAKTVRDFRDLAKGKKETVTHIILDGIGITGLLQQTLCTPLGKLRAANDFDMDLQGVNLKAPVGWPRHSPQFIAEHAVSALVPTPEEMRIAPIEASKQGGASLGVPDDDKLPLVIGAK
jgi:hypothetical protein